jgi:hypothetical protein
MRRHAFFERWHRLTGLSSLIFSSAAVAVFIAPHTKYATWLAALIAIIQAIDLMFETQKRASLHADLRRRYVSLEPTLAASQELAETEYAEAKNSIALIELDEPPIKETLIALAQNDAATVSGYTEEDNPDTFTPLNWFQAHFPNLCP